MGKKLTFVSHESDPMGPGIVRKLRKEHGCSIKILKGDQEAEPTQAAVYTPEYRVVRVKGGRLKQRVQKTFCPPWAKASLMHLPLKGEDVNMASVLGIARQFDDWVVNQVGVPWRATSKTCALTHEDQQWLVKATSVFEAIDWQQTEDLHPEKKKRSSNLQPQLVA